MDTNEIVKALRCSAQIPSNEEQCAGCPYFVLETPSEDDVKELGLEPEWKWKSCNVDRMALDAAGLIERQNVEIKALRGAAESLKAALKDAQKSIEVFGQANAALREKVPEWIPVKERLPEPETEVLIVCNRRGCRFVCPAIYEDGKMLTQDSGWNWNDLYDYGTYSEDDDDYFVPQGWWEDRQFTPDDVYNNPVDCEVTHWMPLPELPEELK